MASVTVEAITIYPAADCKDVYLVHNHGELVATIIEWSDCVEVRVDRILTAEEHAAAMAYVARLQGSATTLVNLAASLDPDPEPPAAAALVPVATPADATPRLRMIVLPVDHDCRCGDSEDDPCPACQHWINRADMTARDRAAAREYEYYDGLAEVA